MTPWNPRLETRRGPIYTALAESIAADIASGALPSGTRLPTHRQLAKQLGITVGTVTRAYAEAHRRGLLSGEVGRGTFVRGPRAETPKLLQHDPIESGLVDLSHNVPNVSIAAEELRAALLWLGRRLDPRGVLQYQPHTGSRRHRQTGARWIERLGLPTHPDDVVITSGAQHAMLIAFSSFLEPGDVVLAEDVTYPGVKAVAGFLRLQLEGVPMDEFGLRADALDDACRRKGAKAVYVLPTIQNPTARVMPEARRREVAAVAKKRGLVVVEDDLFGFLPSAPLAPLVSFADPERSFYLSSLSKAVAPGLRIGYLRAARSRIPALANGIVTTSHMASPLCAEVATLLFEDGAMEGIVKKHRGDVKARQLIARKLLSRWVSKRSSAEGFQLWVELPSAWSSERFAAEARLRGVAVSSSESFLAGRGPAPEAVRISVSAAPSLEVLQTASATLAGLLTGAPAAQPLAQV